MGWLKGFEPSTPGTTNQCSNQLSYSHHHIFQSPEHCPVDEDAFSEQQAGRQAQEFKKETFFTKTTQVSVFYDSYSPKLLFSLSCEHFKSILFAAACTKNRQKAFFYASLLVPL